MRGEFIGVWSETWREIWLPLIDEPLSGSSEGVPEDIFCELYRELVDGLKEPLAEHAIEVALNDALQLREAFEQSLVHSGMPIEVEKVREAFDGLRVSEVLGASSRRAAVEHAIASLIGDSSKAVRLMSQALGELASDPKKRAEAKERAVDCVINNPVASRQAFEAVGSLDLAGERALVDFLEGIHNSLTEISGDELSNRYFNLLARFIEKFSLRYDLRRPCILCPTLSGVFASLVRDLRALTSLDPHLDLLMKDFENAVRDLRQGCSDGRIKTCIQKQVNLLEAIGRGAPGVTGTTLSAICDQVGTWPHEKLRAAMKDLYGFTSDYPGIRHGGTPTSALRAVDMRDLVAMSILLAGFTPYLSAGLNLESVYRGL